MLIFARWVYHGWLVLGGVGNFEPPPSIQSNLDRQKNTFWITVNLLTCFSQHWTRGMNCQSKRGSRNRGTSRPKERRDNSSRILTEKPINTSTWSSRWSGSSNIWTYYFLCYFIRTISDIWKTACIYSQCQTLFNSASWLIIVYYVEFTEKVSVLLCVQH